ncbi:MAG: aspartate--tRNA(Asn) ligase [Candidatus Andersenbacteria bacterium RIFCSPHIGHO2_12_FULL_45_11]|uniref:Aspartate--tRNA ligase n=1 Tax=Candidatus Andersenbacteria bacterium RIFCSPHIGHO2_12_FULL_45_11 TaxID=1797281 RepID=A0A1G1X5I0_9BACT|nr:MAG: aspartate--tRNA(Asn) ligase [Candidatus Andersenbacteria bacterium RIFCSPHIGHO2_12_FULL_45_11]
MQRTLVSSLPAVIGTAICIKGWIQTIRDQKKMQFIILRDHTGSVQVVREKKGDALTTLISSLTAESAVEVKGVVVANDKVKMGQIEITLDDIQVIGVAPSILPITDESSLDLRLDWRFLDLRRPVNHLIFQIQTAAEHAMRQFWTQNGFIEIHSPKFMGSASESGAELFRVEYFGGHAYLAQSPQFYKQMAMAAGFDRVFEVGPVFRANPSFTSRHDTEFTSVDVEISWIDSHHDVMSLEEQWLQYVLQSLKEKYGEAILKHFGVEVVVPTLPFPRITMAEAYEILAKRGHVLSAETKGDLDPEGERQLCTHINEQTGHEFVFVTDYPISVRPFYHMRNANNPGITNSFDLLWKGLEVTTGAQREHRYDILAQQAQEKGLNLEPIQHYMDCFRYGCPPHGGYGFGLTRMLMVLLGVKNVREVTYLYRGPTRLAP